MNCVIMHKTACACLPETLQRFSQEIYRICPPESRNVLRTSTTAAAYPRLRPSTLFLDNSFKTSHDIKIVKLLWPLVTMSGWHP